MDIEKIHDIVALRVVVENIEDCYKVLGIIHSIWKPLPGRIKDYIAVPKPNGYRSIHTTVFTGSGGVAEIQIRTREMHAEAAMVSPLILPIKKKTKKILMKNLNSNGIEELKDFSHELDEPKNI